MKRLILVFALLCASAFGQILAPIVGGGTGAPNPKQNTTAGSCNASPCVTSAFGSNTVTGDSICFFVGWINNVTVTGSSVSAGSASFSDSGVGRIGPIGTVYAQEFCAANITGGTTPTISVTFSGAPSNGFILAEEYSGTAATSLMSNAASGTATSGTSVTTGSFTPTPVRGAVFAACVTGDTNGTAGTGYTARINPAGQGVVLEDKIFTVAQGSQTASCNMSADVSGIGIIISVVIKTP